MHVRNKTMTYPQCQREKLGDTSENVKLPLAHDHADQGEPLLPHHCSK